MHIGKTLAATAFVFGFFSSLAQAAPVQYECINTTKDKYNFITEKFYFLIDQEAGTARVIDGLINHYVGKPIDADLEVRSNGNMFLRWTLDDVKTTNSDGIEISFRSSIRKRDLKFNTSAYIFYDNVPSANGTCKLLS